jgi:hypothetical protein
MMMMHPQLHYLTRRVFIRKALVSIPILFGANSASRRYAAENLDDAATTTTEPHR